MVAGDHNASFSHEIKQDPRWQALCCRDKQADGQFVYAVKTTGIYCAPSCASRLPRRENVIFFDTAQEAEQNGFRPCKRCRQGLTSLLQWQGERIQRACQIIADAEKTPTLAALADAVGISPFYFHRLFKQHLGVTPKGYADALRGQRLRDALQTNTSVTHAALTAGFTSNSQLYHESSAILGMQPSSFKNKGKGMTLSFALERCSIGEIVVAESEQGVCTILLGDDASTLLQELQAMFANATLVGGNRAFEQRMAQVVGFIDTPGTVLPLPLDIRGTVFQQRVWQVLRAIPAGSTLSYQDIARQLGQPDAVRAVAGACAANRLAVAIPCHRVIRSDGALSGYRWGIERKRLLLTREAQEEEHEP